MKEIVAARIGTIITTNRKSILAAIEADTVSEFIERERMQFMAACDLGQKWITLANAPTLFVIDDNGVCTSPWLEGDINGN